ncbi:Rne/Rng family ribonuclease [Edaphobacter aggregans]|uniref:Rne/Rng family ribonuclease n=1 Tax=Edaphobacter aggregans TaxID=570835 RepID=UPI00054E6417|nr:Rne/Rng family ribonuclease [Edaphobacter aggregans]
MSKEIYISSTPHETRLAIVENDALTEIYYERENEYTLAGSIYNGRVTRVLPGMQSSFVDIGLERDAFLYITDFMEEAGDSADFEAEGSQRGGRRDGRDGRDRGSREPVTLEGNQLGDDSGRSGERPSERSDRGDRGRGGRGRRDRRDRGGNRDRQPAEYAASPEAETPYPAPYPTEENYVADEPSEEIRADQPEAALGEGAPGADGSRRWRGRRGRRRGRGQRDDARQQAIGATEPQANVADTDPYESSLEIDGSAEPQREAAAPGFASGVNEFPQESFNRGDRSGSTDRSGRGDRGGRDDRGRGGRDRERGGRRVPRGFAPRTSFYGIESAYDETAAQDAPALEPIVLPGESLSKYRTSGEQPQASAPKLAEPVVAAPSAPSFEIPAGWDGGLVLPGESLSRHRRQERQQPVAETTAIAVPESVAAVPEAIEETIVSEAQPTKLAEPADYEPTEASVSYRFDPIPPSEFRQSAPEEVEPEVEETVLGHPEEHTELPHAEIEQLELSPAAPEPQAEHIHPTPAHEPEGVTHEITSIHGSGEMDSPAPVVADPVEAEAAHQAFEPGTGAIEEEVIDDEDYDTAMLHASSVEELDDLDEEETLEGAADLGTMIREMSIDEITRSGVEDEDDLEEEDAIHDGSFETFEADQIDEAEETEDGFVQEEDVEGEPLAAAEPDGTVPATDRSHDFDRRRGRRDGRRGGRDRARHAGGGGGVDRDRNGGRGRGRSSMQATNLPAISELLKPGQEILVQIAKEPIAKKGARITSHIALPGRFLVFMPTVNHTGVSRKIESDSERRRLKEILLSEKGDAAGGFIVRTAAAGATEEELRSDLRFLLNLWADIKQRSESSKSPALIYHDLNLVERILRDQVTDTFSAIWVDSESEYERVLRFLQRFQPSLIRRVKLYTKETPLFEQFGITEEINKALRSKVWLKSGGSIVINQTEALVAIDINTGKYVGKTARLEDTIVKTNLDAIPEIVRQIRLRDLGGIIIIDFIDMDERKNRNRVMAALEEELKSDRAPSKILQFNDFGLVAITRKRVKQSLERTLSTQCNVCAGTGMVKSPVTVCNDIYVEMRKMARHLDRGDVMLRVHPDVVKQLKSSTKWLQEMEEIVGKTILVKSDPSLHPEQFDIH